VLVGWWIALTRARSNSVHASKEDRLLSRQHANNKPTCAAEVEWERAALKGGYWIVLPPPPGVIWASVGATPVGSKKMAPELEDANPRRPLSPAETGTAVV